MFSNITRCNVKARDNFKKKSKEETTNTMYMNEKMASTEVNLKGV